MAVTTTLYNHTTKLFAAGEVDLTSLKAMLLNDDATALFNATQTNVSSVSSAEVDGAGWTTGGEAIGNAAVTVVTTNDAKLDGDDITVTATGSAIGPAESLVVYDSDSGNLLAFVDFGEAKTADDGTDFKVTWHANGIIAWTYS